MMKPSLACAALALFLAPACAQDKSAETDAPELTRDEIEEIVRAYIMENPEVILESVNAYAERQELESANRFKETARAKLATLLSETDGVVMGPKDAEVVIVEFFDYHCGYCKTASPVIREFAEKDDAVKVVLREFPILKAESVVAAELALAAREQGKYKELHFALMNAGGTLSASRIDSIAKDVGVDVKKLDAARATGTYAETIDRTRALAQEMGVSGTPALIIARTDGTFVEAFSGWTEPGLRAAVDAAKSGAKS